MKSSSSLLTTLLVTLVTIFVEGFIVTTSHLCASTTSSSCVSPLRVLNDTLMECPQHAFFLHFSHSFQRHVVYDSNQSVIGSYEFLDRALEDYPTATLISQGTYSPTSGGDNVYLGCFAGSGVEEQTAYREVWNITSEERSARANLAYDALMKLSELSAEVPQGQHAVALYLAKNSGKLRFINHTPETIKANYKDVTDIFKSLLDMDATDTRQKILSVFPQICLYDTKEIADRMRFFLAPSPPLALVRAKGGDWPLLASHGYGAGLSKVQLRSALRGVPHLMAMYYEDSFLKPAIGYFLHLLQAPFHLANTATIELKQYLDGATFSDIAHVTFLHKLGISWDQLRIIFDAFPTLVVCDTQPSVEMLNKGVVHRDIAPQRLHYLQTRLQVSPSEVKAMLITHTRLGTYSVGGKLKPTLDALQRRLELSSEDVRAILRRQPSLVGMSAAENKGFNKRIDFFLNEVSMTSRDLRRAIVRHPSLLEYSVESSLRPKFSYLRDELFVPENKLAKIAATTPGILGLSLEENIRPSTDQFMEYVEITPKEMGAIIATAPQILASSWKSNLEPKLRYLVNRLDLDTLKLKHIVKCAPRLLLYNIDRSIEPKLLMIEEVLRDSASRYATGQVVHRNPSILVTTNELLRKRLNLATGQPLEAGSDIAAALLPRFSPSSDDGGLIPAYVGSLRRQGQNVLQPRLSMDVGSGGLVSDIVSSNYTLERGFAPGVVPIVAYVAGRIYPRDSRSRTRGSQQKGGLSLFFPQVAYGSPQFKLKFAQIARACFTQLVPETEYNFFGKDGIASVGFPGLWPSRTRTELAACHCALRAVLLMLVQEAGSNPHSKGERFQVDIYTGSESVWRLLRNESRLLEWGEYESTKLLKSSAVGLKASSNADLLFPLCKTVLRMTQYCSVVDQNGNSIRLGKQVKIRFLHVSDGNTEEESIRSLGALARVAAQWYYRRSNSPVVQI